MSESTSTPKKAPDQLESGSTIEDRLRQAAEGLTFPSETDAPLDPFFWKDESSAAPSIELVAAHIDGGAKEIRSQSLSTFFRPVVTEEDWHNEAEKAEVRRFQTLRDFVKTSLKSAKVFRVGKVEIEVYIVGCVEGGYAGFHTKVVET